MTVRQAEDYLLGLELFGMRFGLDRMHKLMTALGHAAAPVRVDPRGRLEREVIDRPVYRSAPRAPRAANGELYVAAPALVQRTDRGGRGALGPERFAAAVARAAAAAAMVERTLDPDDAVTQFEALTAAAYHALASQGSRWR